MAAALRSLSDREGPRHLYQKAATGAGKEELLLKTDLNFRPTGPPMGDLSFLQLTILEQSLMCGFCRCLEIKSHFLFCRLSLAKEMLGSHQTDNG